jgi:hypothetical protein
MSFGHYTTIAHEKKPLIKEIIHSTFHYKDVQQHYKFIVFVKYELFCQVQCAT